MSHSLSLLFKKECPWANCSRNSGENVSKSLSSFFFKEQREWFPCNSNSLEKIHSFHFIFARFSLLSPFYAQERIAPIAHLSIALFYDMSVSLPWLFLKVQSNEIFDPQFFSSFKLAWATDQRVKIFLNLISFSPRYSKFSIEKTDSAKHHSALSKKKI